MEDNPNSLAHIAPVRKAGNEPLHQDGEALPWTLLQFWQWSSSDLVNNALRGQIAEYIVACALGLADGIRIEWASYDLKANDGTTVEVKSAAYLQSWQQMRPSTISFDIRPTLGVQEGTSLYSTERKRQADIYVFALLHHREKATLDPLNVAQWTFYILPTSILNHHMAGQKQVNLSSLLRLEPIQTTYDGVAYAVSQLAGGQ